MSISTTTNHCVELIAGRYSGENGVIWDDRQGAATVTVLLTTGPEGLVSVRRSSLVCEFCGWGGEDMQDDPAWHAEHCASV